ncbi:ubiquinone biosynthesis protein UbiB [Methyloprofundus sedimenti]|uniref:Ubiquinone biosynthesis protein UbiB n=1 Tax=Methyloprofundus sedimenti TaxID=1420851 RepID=A0A1V8M0S1_9GAMM|nr:AarF/UbiB family protein [Methyloprofundus sedimenti]OQK15106.1 ubiquinone biosynthesis protein UbiB [Methyloprofundus sedimenti]
MILGTLNAAKDLGRVHEIALILIRYGFGDMVRRLGLSNIIDRAGKVLHWSEVEELAHLEPPARVRRALEEMGPTYVKLGQILATRADLFSAEWINEFAKLQDQVQAVPFSEIEPQLLEDLGGQIDDFFSEFNHQPFATASIGQVYLARLKRGHQVIVKVRRPGIRPKVEADLRLLKQIAEIAERESKDFRRFQPKEIIHQFTLSMRRELDLAGECRNAERIASAFSNDPVIIIPKVYWQWTSERMNVQEYIDGIPARDLVAINNAGLDRKQLARNGAEIVMKMVLEDGFFHADPHPGNLFFLPENRIAFIDFGMVGRLTEERRSQLVHLLQGVVARNTSQVVRILLKWAGDTLANTESLTTDVDGLIDQYHDVSLKDIDIAGFLNDLTTLLRDHQLKLPPDLTLLMKTLITLEGMGRQLDPDFNIVQVATPFLQRALFKRYTPDAIVKQSWQSFSGMLELLTELPNDLHRLLDLARRGALGVRLDIAKPEWLAKELDRVVNRLSVSLITSALIVGSSIVSTVEGGASSFLGLIGFVGAFMGGIWLLFSIWRSG